jgi:hypothetical protein
MNQKLIVLTFDKQARNFSNLPPKEREDGRMEDTLVVVGSHAQGDKQVDLVAQFIRPGTLSN